jgi:uncharacterized protein YbjT (DUF2867 family)
MQSGFAREYFKMLASASLTPPCTESLSPQLSLFRPSPSFAHQPSMAKNTYTIVGASGNTGHVVASKLLEQGQNVRVIGRSADRLQPLVQRGAEPFVADATDTAALARAFNGARGVYAMVPPNLTAPDVRDYQNRVSDAIGSALEQARVPSVVILSSFGADKESGTGPVVGLHYLEQRINRVPGINALYLRAGYFMENTLPQAQVIKQFGMVGGPLRPDLKVPMIATRDIGTVAADRLLKLDFSGHSTRELLGQRDLNYTEVATIIGKAIGKPDLKYTQLPDAQFRAFLLQMGAAPNFADLMQEMSAALNSGQMRALEPRSSANTTPTPFEDFVRETFVPAYQGRSKAA